MDFQIRRHSASVSWTYAQLDLEQRRLAAEVGQGKPGRFLLSELAPVITLGRRAKPETLLFSAEKFQALGIEIFPTDRGGFETYHGPGQWVLFVVESLKRLTGDPRGVRQAVDGLLQIGLKTALFYDSSAEIRSGAETGIWTHRGKVASVGVQVVEGVLLHGLSINGFQTELSFQGLNPCGLRAEVSYLLEGRRGGASSPASRESMGSPNRESEFIAMGEAIQKFAHQVFEGH